jgi:Ca-activated chloride channel family protein
LGPADRTMIMAISSEAEVVAPLEMERADQLKQIARLDPWSTTALHDAVIAALDRLEGEKGRQAIVVFSDGTDRYSRASAAEVVERARGSRALIYPIGLGRQRVPLLAELAVTTGGRSFLVRDVKDLGPALADVARELRSQYLLGYSPSVRNDGRRSGWRSISVVVRKPGLRVRARDGYLAG